jgi:hypothetical protein
MPDVHTLPSVGQKRPHPPQFFGSLEGSMQVPAQKASPAGHGTHWLFTQILFAHFTPHPPQFLMSLVMSSQVLPVSHRARPGGHAYWQ